MQGAEPIVALPGAVGPAKVPETRGRTPARYAPERGLVRRLRTAQAHGDIEKLVARHQLDRETREVLAAELIKAGAPPITPEAAKAALSRLIGFEPLNADALRPFLLLTPDRALRSEAMAMVGDAMRQAGRSVRLLSDTVDIRGDAALKSAGKRLGCGVTQYDGASNCLELLRKTDLACLCLIEAGFRTPLDKVALLRINTLINATGAEPVVVMRPSDVAIAAALSKIGVKRIILVKSKVNEGLGAVLTALRDDNLTVAEILDHDAETPILRPASPAQMAEMLVD